MWLGRSRVTRVTGHVTGRWESQSSISLQTDKMRTALLSFLPLLSLLVQVQALPVSWFEVRLARWWPRCCRAPPAPPVTARAASPPATPATSAPCAPSALDKLCEDQQGCGAVCLTVCCRGPCEKCSYCEGGAAGCKKICNEGKKEQICKDCIANCSWCVVIPPFIVKF